MMSCVFGRVGSRSHYDEMMPFLGLVVMERGMGFTVLCMFKSS